MAILHKAKEPGSVSNWCKVGYGITVQINGRRIRVGSKRFMELEGLPPLHAGSERGAGRGSF